MKPLKVTIISTVIFFLSSALYAEISVMSVKGNAAYREGRNWVPLKENMKLSEGVKISTGANSSAELKLNALNHTVKIKPLTVIQVFSKTNEESSDTHIGLKRGSINARVPRDSKVKTIFKVSSPIATSSVRGTEENISYGPVNGMIVEVISGLIAGENRAGRVALISGRQKFTQTLTNAQFLNILDDVKNNTFIPVSGQGLTDDETASGTYSGGDQIGGPDGDTFNLDNQYNRTTRTNLTIDWPDKPTR